MNVFSSELLDGGSAAVLVIEGTFERLFEFFNFFVKSSNGPIFVLNYGGEFWSYEYLYFFHPCLSEGLMIWTEYFVWDCSALSLTWYNTNINKISPEAHRLCHFFIHEPLSPSFLYLLSYKAASYGLHVLTATNICFGILWIINRLNVFTLIFFHFFEKNRLSNLLWRNWANELKNLLGNVVCW